MQILEDLSGIAWSEKAVASGKADKVPQALRGLLSPDADLRNRSYWQLDNEVVLQSDLYEAAYFVIPFLIHSLNDKILLGRNRIYALLYEIANGAAPANFVCQTNEGDEIPLKEACDRELRKGLNVYVRDAADPNPQISGKAKKLIELLDPDLASLCAENDWESISLANNPQFRRIIEKSRRSYREKGGITSEDLRKELNLKAKKPGSRRKKP